MGCGFSKDKTDSNDGNGNLRDRQPLGSNADKGDGQKRVHDDFRDNIHSNPDEGLQEGELQPEFMLVNPPPYSVTKCENEVEKPIGAAKVILDTVRKVHHTQRHGINGGFGVLRERHIHVWIDPSYLLSKNTKVSLQLLATIHLQLGQAMESDMTFLFTSYPNLLSENLTEAERQQLRQLIRLWETPSWAKANEMVQRNDILCDRFSLSRWMADTEKFKSNKQTAEQSEGEASQMTANEKHTILLVHVRNLMLQFWHGWHQSDFAGPDDLFKLCKEAIKAAKRQRKSLNSVRFTYQREIELYLRLREQKEAYPVTCFPLIGSMMQSSEVNAIINFQQVNGQKLKKQLTDLPPPKKKLWIIGGTHSSAVDETDTNRDTMKRRDLPFQITGMVDIEGMSNDAVQGFISIDNAQTDDDDINDIKMFMHTKYLERFISDRAMFSYYNGHNKDVDEEELKQDDMYGEQPLTTAMNRTIIVPHVTEFMKILGRDMDDWEEPKSKIQVVDYDKVSDDETWVIRALAPE